MPRRNSPIRPDKVKEGREFLKKHDLEEATINQKLWFLFRRRTTFADGLSILEIALIIHPERSEIVQIKDKDGNIHEIERPTREGESQTKQETKDFREYCFEVGGIIFYCHSDRTTGAQIYFNMTTEEFLKYIMELHNKITRGCQKNKKRIKNFLKLPKKLKDQIANNTANRLRKEVMEHMMKKEKRKRKKQMKEQIQQYVQ